MNPLLKVNFSGVRGSIAVNDGTYNRYGGSTSSVQLIFDNAAEIILDGGSGIYRIGQKYMSRGPAGIPENLLILISHQHWDHIQGLPFFVPMYIPKKKITICGCNQGSQLFKDILSGQMRDPYFPVEIQNWMADIDYRSIGETSFDFCDINIASINAEHPGMTLGFRITYKNKSIVYMPDNELFAKFSAEKVYTKYQGNLDNETDMSLIILEEQKKKFFGFIEKADLFIHDSQYTRDEYKTKIGWGHSCFEDAVNAGIYADVGHIVLFHHDPSHNDNKIDEMLSRALEIRDSLNSYCEITAASQSSEIELYE